jgi:lipopolysaccharide export system permease protein
MNKTEDSLFKYDPKMLSVRQLNTAIDSLSETENKFIKRSGRELSPFLSFLRFKDSAWSKKDTASKPVKKFDDVIPDSLESIIYDRASSQINSLKGTSDLLAADYKTKNESLRKHLIEWNRKFTLSVACLVLFMIGAPLGSIIRKGGLGTPLIFAIIFFVLFHLLNTFGEKFAKEAVLTPFAGMWLSTAVLIPVGIFLTVKAMRDSQLFNKEFYYRSFRSFKKYIASKRSIKTEPQNVAI